jgi:hypothetical protein
MHKCVGQDRVRILKKGNREKNKDKGDEGVE